LCHLARHVREGCNKAKLENAWRCAAELYSGEGGHSHCPAPKFRGSYRSAAGVTGAAMLQRSQVNRVRKQRGQGKSACVFCRARDCDCFRRRARRSDDMRKVDLRAWLPSMAAGKNDPAQIAALNGSACHPRMRLQRSNDLRSVRSCWAQKCQVAQPAGKRDGITSKSRWIVCKVTSSRMANGR
jgi:hypothetical protein